MIAPDMYEASNWKELGAALEAMADGLIVANIATGVVMLNRAARSMLEIPPDDQVSTAYLKDSVGFYPFELTGHKPVREELRIGERILHSVVTPIVSDGAITGATVVLRDLGTGEAAQQRAHFAQVMAHELRSPLTSITGALDIVQSGYAGGLNEKQLRYVEMARTGATRMSQMVDQLLDLARAQAGTIRVATTPVLLDRLTKDVIARYQTSAAAKQLALRFASTADDITVLGDPDRLTQVLGNLLSNAIRFSPAGGDISIEVFGPPFVPDAVGVSVQNFGEPITEFDRERIFEPFSASSRRVGGSALGLSISRTIIEAHGGRIWVDSEASSTKFVFTLPAAHAEEAPRPLSHRRPLQAKRGEGATVLIIDDDTRRVLLMKGLLMATCDRIVTASDGDSGLALARQEKPTLTVVAGALPQATSVLAVLDHDPDTASTAIMALGERDQRSALLAAGANDVCELPLMPAAFRESCLRLLETGRRAAPRVLLVDDDSATRAICKEVLELGGYQVCDVANPEHAMDEARRFRPDLCLLDVMMANMDGYKLSEAIRADTVLGMTPIIFVSGRGDTADKVRAFRVGAEDYIVKPFDAAELLARVGKALDRQARQVGASPTTQLPGADAIQAEIDRRLAANDMRAMVVYLDLDNLKAFNDYYGYAKANAVISQTGDLIREVVTAMGGPGDFIGHIAGDDFVFVTTRDRVDGLCIRICNRFDDIIRMYYDKTDRARGHIATKDRFGVLREFPLMSVSIAGVTLARAKTYAAIAELAAQGKQLAKAIVGSAYVRDTDVVPLR